MSSSSRSKQEPENPVHVPRLLHKQSANAQAASHIRFAGPSASPACPLGDTPIPQSRKLDKSSRPNPISVLHQFLLHDSEPMQVLHTHTPNTIRSLYLSARSQKHLLTSSQLSSLISLFGSLSINSPHALRPLLRNRDHPKAYWGFLSKMIYDQRILGHELGLIDRYWIMRSCLFRISKMDATVDFGNVNRVLSATRVQYNHLRFVQEPSDVHVCFAEALLARGVSDHLPEAVDVLCDMLNAQPELDHAQLALVWKIILAVGSLPTCSHPSSEFRVKITNALYGRFRTAESEIKNLAEEGFTGDGEPDVHDVVMTLRSTMLLLPSTQKAVYPLLPWAVRETRAALFPETDGKVALALSWRNLCFMALVCSPLDTEIRVKRLGKNVDLHSVHWQIFCVLAILDRLLQSDGVDHPRQIVEAIINVLEPVWNLWIQASNKDYKWPIAIDRAIAIIILRCAGVIHDRSLQISCQQYAESRGFWFHQQSPMLQVEFALTSILCGEHDWQAIFPDLKEHALSDRVVEETISRCITVNFTSAHELYVSSRHRSIKLSSKTIAELGQTAAVTDPVFGVAYLNDRRLSLTQLKCILENLLNSSAGLINVKHSENHLITIAKAMLSVYACSCPPLESRRRIEGIMLAMMCASTDCGLRAVRIMTAIHRISAKFLRPKFISSALHCLLSRRFYWVAFRLFRFAANIFIGQSRRWQRMLITGFAHGKAHALAVRTYNTHPSPVLCSIPTISLLRITRFNTRQPARVDALKIFRKMKDKNDLGGRELGYAITLLVRGRRILAAKTLYARTRHQVEDDSRTVAGNAILHASFASTKRRNAQRMQKILRTLQELMNDYGFVPDRITINIFIKGILMWDKIMDTERLRGLFDHLISSGYPGGMQNQQDSIVKPFGTKNSFVPPEVPLVDPSMPISFRRHVRPLYNMFIKAFHRRGDRQAALVVVGIMKRAAIQAEGMKRK